MKSSTDSLLSGYTNHHHHHCLLRKMAAEYRTHVHMYTYKVIYISYTSFTFFYIYICI